MSDLAEVKNRIMGRVDLAQLIGENIKLERRSGRLFGLCPFHNEKSPSFTIYGDHYHCFGCKESGDAIDYVRKTAGLGFVDALRYLAQKYSVQAPELERKSSWQGERRKQASDYRALAAAHRWFMEQLNSPLGEKTRSYLRSRGFDDQAIKNFEFGFAPDDFQLFPKAMHSHGFDTDALIETSLARRSQKSGRPYAFFRNRLMVPIHDNFGRVIAFGGRTMGDDPAKYVNSSETYIFDKSRTLFGLYQAKDAIRKAGYAFVVEGYMDVLKLRHLGVTNTVACMGTALTTKQLSQLSQFTGSVYLCFDGDSSGVKANLSTVASALEVPRISVQVIRLPAEHDPDSFISEQGSGAFQALKEQAVDILSFAIDARLAANRDLSRPHLVKSEFIPWLVRIADNMQRSYLMSRISQLTGIALTNIEQEYRAQTAGRRPSATRPLQRSKTQPLRAHDFDLLGHIYYAQPGEFDTDELKRRILAKCEFDDAWGLLIDDMLGSLKQNSPPYIAAKAEWASATDMLILDTLKRFDEMRSAFTGSDHALAIDSIMREQGQNKRQATIKTLKAKLAGASPEEQDEILRAIKELKSE